MTKRRAALLDIIRRKRVSDAALADILASISKHNLPAMSRTAIGRLSAAEFNEVGITLSLPLQSGRSFAWEVVDLGKLCAYFMRECNSFRDLMQKATLQHNTLELILYLDEVTPGNVLRPDNKRKIWAIYGSFHQFGGTALQAESAWLTLACLRSDIAKQVTGGVSSAMRVLLKSIFDEGSQDVSRRGLFLNTNPPRLVLVTLRSIIADAPAIKQCFNFKGATGIKPCPTCLNVMKRGFPGCLGSDVLVDITCTDMSKVVLATDDDLWKSFDSMTDITTRAALDRVEKATGINFSKHSVLADVELRRHVRPVTSIRWDWVHILMVGGGVLSHELFTFMSSCKFEFGFDYNVFHEFVTADWCFAANRSTDKSRLRYIFTEARARASNEAEGFKAMASEHLLVYGLVRHFARTIVEPSGRLAEAVAILSAVCDVVDAIQQRKQGKGTPTKIRVAVAEYHRLAKESRGVDSWRWKHHAMLHIADQAERDGLLVDTFVHERKHQIMKHAATVTTNLTVFERSTLSSAILEQRRQLGNWSSANVLIGRAHADTSEFLSEWGLTDTWFAKGVEFEGAVHHIGDVVFVDQAAARVELCFRAGSQFGLVVSPMRLCRRVHSSASEWVEAGEKDVIFSRALT
jgi:hypothetical protein